jgi:hypothetical protein
MSARTDEELLRIVGAARGEHSPEVVAEAEAELQARLSFPKADAGQRLRTAARVSVAFGLVSVCGPFLMLRDPVTPDVAVPLGFAVQAWGQAALGLVLALGGVGLWQHRVWGRRLVVFVLWAATAYVVGFTVYFGVAAAAGAPAGFRIMLGVVATLMGVLWVLLLRRGIRFLSQPMIDSLLRGKELRGGCRRAST